MVGTPAAFAVKVGFVEDVAFFGGDEKEIGVVAWFYFPFALHSVEFGGSFAEHSDDFWECEFAFVGEGEENGEHGFDSGHSAWGGWVGFVLFRKRMRCVV